MSVLIEPRNTDVATLNPPSGFWAAFCVETPVSKIIDCEYLREGYGIRYEHEGFVGAWFSKDEAIEMHKILLDYIETDEYDNHRYFSLRKNQMESIMEFLLECDGFRKLD